MTQTFDLLNTDLSGVNLIEASAGTGKTFTIAAIYLRLIIETGLTVDNILVVTFTEAATAELKDRIRNRLRDAALAFESGESDDPFLRGLIHRHSDRQAALDRLRSAVRDFDEAAIFTIHGFCMRMLRENAFESGGLFDTELMIDMESLKREVVQDFWRRHFYGASPLFINYALGRDYAPETYLGLLNNAVGVQKPRIVPRVEIPDTAPLENAYRDAYLAAAGIWSESKDELAALLMNSPGLHGGKYPQKHLPDWIAAVDAYMKMGPDSPAMPDKFVKFTAEALAGGVRKNGTPPVHPFFDACGVLYNAYVPLKTAFDDRLMGLKIALFDTAAEALREKKARRNRISFDDLLLNVHDALTAENGPALAAAIRSRFGAALIDEFQDTDPVQYAIFRRLFTGPERLLFLIGDPKQAIYRFRGADIFAYMAAKERAEHRYTLGENWRSEPELVAAVNTVFGNAAQPFLYDAIPFDPVSPAENRPNPTRLTLDGRPAPPLQIWRMTPEEGKKHVTKGEARGRIDRATASGIARLIALGREGRVRIDQDPLRPGDIAVLLRTNREARNMQRALYAVGVPAVLHSTENLFDAREAAEMETVLRAMARPGDGRLVRSALSTDVMGLSANEIDRFSTEEAAWEDWLIAFRDFHELWGRRGFMRAFKALLFRTGALPRLMALPDGERRCTNLRHLAEVLHGVEMSERPGMSGLVKWLSRQRAGGVRGEEHQLRLESDARAVKLATIHKSKGLEYPVVFCPYLWKPSKTDAKAPVVAFHDETDGQLTFDLGSDAVGVHRAMADKENLAENLRLLYVAMTRARNRCVIVWGLFYQAETAAPTWIFHPPTDAGPDDPLKAMSAHYKGLGAEGVTADLDRLAAASNGTIAVHPLPETGAAEASPAAVEPPDLSARVFTGTIDDRFRVASFSALTRGGETATPHLGEPADRDADIAPEPAPEAPKPAPSERRRTIFSFPRGARPGTFLHTLFEHLDFTDLRREILDPVVSENLASHGFEPEWKDVVVGMIQNVLGAPLVPDRPDFTLSRLENGHRLNELGFYFPLNPIGPEKLAAAFEPLTVADLQRKTGAPPSRLDFNPTEGFMLGFMDLVFRFEDRFYLLDWKSNHLGDDIDAYHRSRLGEAMAAHHYDLQYCLYTVALDQYLRTRLPDYRYDAHFGGVFYLFLRGMDPRMGADHGIFHDRPAPERIAALADVLIDRRRMAEAT